MATTMGVRELSDAELIASARKGGSDAFGELYRRHVDSARAAARALTRSHSDADDLTSEAFARVLRALQNGGGPEVSFRPYLVTAVRNVFYDKVRRNREEPSPDMSDEVNVALLDAANSQEDGAFAAAAFAALPERWQLVLWHTEVEGRTVAEVAPLLGLAPNAVAALAYRAREGLRQAYLQAHLRDQQAAECRECSASLGAYVRDGLSARDRRRIDAHLEGCESCTALVAELTDTNNTLRAALIPALIGVAPAAYLSGLSGGGPLARLSRMSRGQQVVAGAAVAASVVAIAALAGAFGGGGAPESFSAASSTAVTQTAVVTPTDDSVVSTVARTTEPRSTEPRTTEPRTTVPPATTGTTTLVTTPQSQPPVVPPTTVRRPTPPPATNPPSTTPKTTPTPTPTTTPVPTTTQPPVPSSMSVVTQQRAPALINGELRLLTTVTNTGTAAINGIQLNVPAPGGSTLLRAEALSGAQAAATFVSGAGAGWSCTASGSCMLPALEPGQSSVLQLTYQISPSAPATITFSPSVAAPLEAAVTSAPITVPVATVPDLLAAEVARGALRAIGNTVVTCDDLSPNCVDARAGTATGTAQDHNDHAMQFVKTAGGVINSSSAQLSVTGSVWRAYLAWSGDLDQGGLAPNPADFDKVSFTTPGGTTVVTADRTQNFDAAVPGNLGMYAAYADVTDLVTGSGTYSVADVQTALGTASFGGWSLIVIDHDPSLPERFMMVTAPLKVVSGTSSATSLSFGVDLPQPMSNASGQMVVAGFEGDRSLELDQVSLSGFVVSNPFQGVIDGARDVAFQNSLGTDVFVATTTGMNGGRLAFNSRSNNDRIILPLVGIALDL